MFLADSLSLILGIALGSSFGMIFGVVKYVLGISSASCIVWL